MADNQHDLGPNRSGVIKTIAFLVTIVIIVFLFFLFENLNTKTTQTPPTPKSQVTTYTYTKSHFYGRNGIQKIIENAEMGNGYLKQIAENTARTNEKIDNLRADVNNLRSEVNGLRDDVRAGMADIRQDVNNGFAETHTDLIVLNRTVKSLGDLGKCKKRLGEKKDSYWDIPEGAKQ